MMRLPVIVMLLLVLQSCSSEPHVPKHILQPKKMEILLLDMLKSDEYINLYIINDSLNTKRENLYQKVLAIHKVSKQDFKKSIYFYQAHPNLFKEVLNSMHDKMKPAVADKPKDSIKVQ